VKELFPSIRFGKNNGFHTVQGFLSIKGKVEKLSGVEFKLKDFRSTLTSITVNGNMCRLPAMSAQLRHDKIETTQKSYYRVQDGVAGRQLRDAWKERLIAIDKHALLIENRKG
jgi:integrase/recombinase XerD